MRKDKKRAIYYELEINGVVAWSGANRKAGLVLQLIHGGVLYRCEEKLAS